MRPRVEEQPPAVRGWPLPAGWLQPLAPPESSLTDPDVRAKVEAGVKAYFETAVPAGQRVFQLNDVQRHAACPTHVSDLVKGLRGLDGAGASVAATIRGQVDEIEIDRSGYDLSNRGEEVFSVHGRARGDDRMLAVDRIDSGDEAEQEVRHAHQMVQELLTSTQEVLPGHGRGVPVLATCLDLALPAIRKWLAEAPTGYALRLHEHHACVRVGDDPTIDERLSVLGHDSFGGLAVAHVFDVFRAEPDEDGVRTLVTRELVVQRPRGFVAEYLVEVEQDGPHYFVARPAVPPMEAPSEAGRAAAKALALRAVALPAESRVRQYRLDEFHHPNTAPWLNMARCVQLSKATRPL